LVDKGLDEVNRPDYSLPQIIGQQTEENKDGNDE